MMSKQSIRNETDRFDFIEDVNQLDLTRDNFTGEIIKIRCPARHKRFMQMIERARQLSKDNRPFKKFRQAVTMQAGFVDEVVLLDGSIGFPAKSLSFELKTSFKIATIKA